MTQPTQAQIEALRRWQGIIEQAMSENVSSDTYLELKQVDVEMSAVIQALKDKPTQAQIEALRALLVATIERCAQVAEQHCCEECGSQIAAAIRALADKPQPDPNIICPGKDLTNVFPEEEP